MARVLLGVLLASAAVASGLVFPGPSRLPTRLHGERVQVKFRIYPDGRVEETVLGVKGMDCQKVTEELNAKLGTVISTTPTEEMFQEKVVDTNTVKEAASTGSEETASQSPYQTKFSEW
mmetsp:Transcript_10555/g.33744  ORF Transcript_10555/g.33744 Transcript_10555/m.33744 type:complete len:119 (+) Transcript_10555:58-414(+)